MIPKIDEPLVMHKSLLLERVFKVTFRRVFGLFLPPKSAQKNRKIDRNLF